MNSQAIDSGSDERRRDGPVRDHQVFVDREAAERFAVEFELPSLLHVAMTDAQRRFRRDSGIRGKLEREFIGLGLRGKLRPLASLTEANVVHACIKHALVGRGADRRYGNEEDNRGNRRQVDENPVLPRSFRKRRSCRHLG